MPHGEWPESKNIPAPGLGDWLDVFTRVGNTKDKQFWERRLFRFRVHRRALLLSRFSRVRLCATPETAAHQAPRPWDSPGKNTGVDCPFLLQCMKVKSPSEVAQSCPTLSDPMDCSPPGSSVHGIFQARVLEWGAIAFSARRAH